VLKRATDDAIGVRRLGFGVSGPHATPLIPARATEALILRAFELGVRLFDTGPSYGNGEAERRLGSTIRDWLPRIQCIVSTKVGVQAGGARDFSPDAVRRSIDASLKRLKLSTIDWLLLHGPSPSELTDALFKTLIEEQFQGRIGLIGVAGRGPELDAALSAGVFSIFMTPVHPGLDTAQQARLARLRSAGAEIVGIEAVAPSLPRYPLPASRSAMWRLARSLMRPAPPPPRLDHRLRPADAIAWALTRGGAHRVVTTTTRAVHIAENVRAIERLPRPRLIAEGSGPS
jgi:aryl-alcohol dehydrogenase-like predicted oxidoreductase